MTLDEYWAKVNEVFLKNLTMKDKWRWGQTCMNVLREENPRLWLRCYLTEWDVFQCDVSTKTYDRFVEFLEQNWGAYDG